MNPPRLFEIKNCVLGIERSMRPQDEVKFGTGPNSKNPTRLCCLNDLYQIRNIVVFGTIVVY